jgi:hypothetical protein
MIFKEVIGLKIESNLIHSFVSFKNAFCAVGVLPIILRTEILLGDQPEIYFPSKGGKTTKNRI